MRVIAGSARRLLLKTVDGMETRPTTDRIKETLFNMLQNDLYGARFLDLFAGSGAIGIEALSRGAKEAVFVDKGDGQISCIRENLKTTHLEEKARVMSGDVSEAVRKLDRDGKSFDYIFMDSPAGLGDGFQLAMAAADRVIVVSATDPAALRDAQRTVAELLPQVSEIHLVMNRVQPKLIRKLRTSIDEAMDTAGLPLLGIVPEDKQVMLAAGQGLPLVLYAHKDAARAYLNIAKRLMGAKVPLLRIH